MKRLITLFFSLVTVVSFAQQRTPYNQYFLNPALINPAFLGESGYTSVFLNHRMQWIGLDDGPVSTTAMIQAPVNERLSLGGQLMKDYHSSALQTYEANFLVGYNVFLDRSGQRYLSFGLGLGAGRNVINFDGFDQAIMNAQDKSFYFSGQFGMAVHLQRLKVGFSLPQLMDTDILNKKNFEDLGLEAAEHTITYASYRIALSPLFELEPSVLYRSDKQGTSQWEGLGMLYYKDVLWIGGGYRQEYGAVANFGLTVNKSFKFSYSYEFAPKVTTGIGNGSHEFQIALQIGKRNKKNRQRIISDNTTEGSFLPESTDEPTQTDSRYITTSDPVASTSMTPIAPTESDKNEKTRALENDDEVANKQLVETSRDAWEVTTQKNIESSLDPGYYLVVGAFKKEDNAKRYNQAIEKRGYTCSMAFDNVTKFNYVYLNHSSQENSLAGQRDTIRNTNILYFPDAWILHIR